MSCPVAPFFYRSRNEGLQLFFWKHWKPKKENSHRMIYCFPKDKRAKVFVERKQDPALVKRSLKYSTVINSRVGFADPVHIVPALP